MDKLKDELENDGAHRQLPDFDTLKRMAEQQPEALEALRVKLTKELLASVPEHRRRRLEGTQFLIDMTRRRAKNPLQCCVKLSALMWDSFYDLRATLNETPIEAVTAAPPPAPTLSTPTPTATDATSNVVRLFPSAPGRAERQDG